LGTRGEEENGTQDVGCVPGKGRRRGKGGVRLEVGKGTVFEKAMGGASYNNL